MQNFGNIGVDHTARIYYFLRVFRGAFIKCDRKDSEVLSAVSDKVAATAATREKSLFIILGKIVSACLVTTTVAPSGFAA